MPVGPADPTPRDELLDEIVADYLEAVEAGNAPDRQALLGRHPELADELAAFFRDQDRFDALVSPLRSSHGSDTSSFRTPGSWPRGDAMRTPGSVFGPYELQEEIGRGGMGVVYRARDRRLGRLVALKMILAGRLASAADVRRFRAEAEAVAQIDHPNIVPVLDVGEHEGQAWFSMKLIEGGSLSRRARDFVGWPRETARLLAVIARAVHHAHQCGVLHRDLKPGNILLAKRGHSSFSPSDGEKDECPLFASCASHEQDPYVTDFGLAKRVSAPSGDDLTGSGAIVGTPSYMAPEQAGGRSRTVTVAADVYSLGAILFELLAGRPPFRAATPMDTLLAVLHNEPPRPRSIDSRIPRDLETVCLKCLEKDPSRRYSSALALAEELERFLNGEPVHARPAGTVERFVRWCSRHPVVSGLSAALVLSIVAGFLLVGWQWWRAEENLVEAHLQKAAAESASLLAEENARKADENAREADEHFWTAHRAVKEFCLRAQEELARSPGTQPFRRQLLQSARSYYQDFVRRRSDDPALREELADVHHHLAWITTEIGSRAEALEAHRQALAIYEELAQTRQDPPTLTRVASTLHNIGMLSHDTGHAAESMAAYQRAREIYQHLVCFDPADANSRAFLANTCNSLGIRHVEAGRTDDALECYRLAIGLREQVLREHPGHPKALGDLGMSVHNLGVLRERLGRKADALRQYEQARDLYEERVKGNPRNAGFQADLASEHHSLAIVLRALKRKPEALNAARKAQDIREQLVRENPSVTSYQVALAASHSTAGIAHSDSEQRLEAIACFDRARVILEKLVQKDGSAGHYRKDLAQSWFNMGVQYGNLGRNDEAGMAYEKARDLLEKLTQDEPDRLDLHHDLGGVLNNLGVVLGKQGRTEESLATLRRGIEEHRLTFTKAPGVPYHRGSLSICYAALAGVLRRAGLLSEAIEVTQERRKLWPKDGVEQALAGCELALTAAVVPQGGTDRERYCELAVEAIRQALANGYRDVEQLRKHPDLTVLRGRADFEKLLSSTP